MDIRSRKLSFHLSRLYCVFFFLKDSSDDQVAKQVGQNSITEGAVAGRMRNYQLCHRLNDHPFCVITSIWLSLSVGIVE